MENENFESLSVPILQWLLEPYGWIQATLALRGSTEVEFTVVRVLLKRRYARLAEDYLQRTSEHFGDWLNK